MNDLYASLDIEARIVVQQRTSEIRTLMQRTAQDLVEIGQKLVEVKARLGHGLFGAWLQAEFEWSERTAQRYMSVAQAFKSDTVECSLPRNRASMVGGRQVDLLRSRLLLCRKNRRSSHHYQATAVPPFRRRRATTATSGIPQPSTLKRHGR